MSSGSSLPKYLVVSERLTREIAAGRLAPGTRLPPEREMAEAEGIAIGTLRKALAELEARGLLVRRQGSGNYIQKGEGRGIYAFLRLERPEGGGLPTADTLSVVTRRGQHRIRRLRRLDGQPVALEEILLDQGRAPCLAAPLPDALYRHYADAFGLVIARIEDRVGIAPVPDWAPEDFPLPSQSLAGHVARTAWAADDKAVETSETWFDPGAAQYISRDSLRTG
ncbi:GntR family transcriptional regulator [Aestuariibius sp. 2305UL40-4]|uniref:GntR family transcriptional regulator n=1 Tax=Aestuariibius violaceus TaxID=3234132 RepID=UPI00345EDA2F